ncbi:MAG: GGDEF domain-containing protein [Treponema sp.]|nr:GGDEF domain-containing protein [Candidatus Treponema equifaecale]
MDEFFSKRNNEIDDITRVFGKSAIFDYARYLVREHQKFSLFLVDIDNFKYIVDTYGHDSANKVLYKVAQRIVERVGEKGAVGRIGGDTFAVILKNMVSYDEVWSLCHSLLVNMNEVEISDFAGLTLTLTIGLSRYPDNGSSFDAIYEASEKALSRGKTKGRNCFIIYLPEKHASIVVKSQEDKALSSTNLHSSVFKFLSASDSLSECIENLLNFLSSYFELDHICIQNNGRILFQKIHQMAKNKDFEAVPVEYIKSSMNKSTEMYCVNDIKYLLQTKQIDLFETLAKQCVSSTSFFEISYQNEIYGYLRADMTGTGKDVRIWQYADLDILYTTAKTLAFILHYSGKKLENL